MSPLAIAERRDGQAVDGWERVSDERYRAGPDSPSRRPRFAAWQGEP